jgi:bifunctional UDP-N-acetylglucosamine pyrophosphorylase/glucosamine-1-phosphate N-acetyltransferase
VPAAGLGSRLGAAVPKLLVRVAGVPMIDRILELYRDVVDRAVIVVNPRVQAEVRRHMGAHRSGLRIDCVEQQEPTGMLDAILLAAPFVHEFVPVSVWITWCDQVAVHRSTIATLAMRTQEHPHPAVVMPTVIRAHPYIHFERDSAGRIVRVRHRREGDEMPDVGEGDIGLFALSSAAFTESLPQYSREVEAGAGTGERNFLPFIPWVGRAQDVVTFPCTDPMEAVGINTPEELRIVEHYLGQPEGWPHSVSGGPTA